MTGAGTPALSTPPALPDARTASELRAALAAAEFTAERIEAALGSGELSAAPGELAVQRRRLAGRDDFAVLARLLLLGEVVDAEDVTRALTPGTVERLSSTELLRPTGGGVRATARLLPHGDYLIASDAAVADPPADWVAGVQAPSVTLAKLAVRQHVEATLDVCTGCGIQALLAAKHSGRVVATDVNRRALAFAGFNAALNEVPGIEPRHGNLLEPAAGETFGLIIANPPYVISPDSTYLYRDSSYPADEVCRRLVEGIPARLAEGGFAHVLVSWAERGGASWEQLLREWVRGSGCDAWLLHYKTDDPLTHAAGWLSPLAISPEEHEAALERWLAYLRGNEIEAVGYGAIVLRRRAAGLGWVRLDELPLERLEPAGEHTLRVFAAEDFLAGLPDERVLLEERFELVGSHRLEQQLVCRGGRFQVEQQTLVLTEGLAFHAGLDRNTLVLLPHFERGRRLVDVLAAAAVDLDVDPGDRERFATAAIPVVRRLFELGFLVRSA